MRERRMWILLKCSAPIVLQQSAENHLVVWGGRFGSGGIFSPLQHYILFSVTARWISEPGILGSI